MNPWPPSPVSGAEQVAVLARSLGTPGSKAGCELAGSIAQTAVNAAAIAISLLRVGLNPSAVLPRGNQRPESRERLRADPFDPRQRLDHLEIDFQMRFRCVQRVMVRPRCGVALLVVLPRLHDP